MSVKNKNILHKAFTLVEVVIVISIIMIMTAVLLSQLGDRSSDRELQVSMREVASGLRQVQNFALTGKVIDGLRPCDYFFDTTGSNTFRVRYVGYDPTDDDTSCEENFEPIATRETVTVSTGISIDAVDLGFIVPSGRVYDTSTPGEILPTTEVRLTKEGLTYLICIHASGRIEERGRETSCN